MRTLERNKQQFWYATYEGEQEIIDEYGLHTGEKTTVYSPWKPFRANISPAKGYSEAEVFGTDIQYDRVFVTDDVNCEIDENTVLAVDIAPNERDNETVLPVFDYVVTRRAPSLNVVSYAISKVKTNA